MSFPLISTSMDILSINSTQSEGNQSVNFFLKDLVEKHSYFSDLKVSESKFGLNSNLIMEAGSKGLFVFNTDLPFVSQQNYYELELDAKFEDDTLYGVGIHSGKIDLICFLKAFYELKTEGFTPQVSALSTFGRNHRNSGLLRVRKDINFEEVELMLLNFPTGKKGGVASYGKILVELFLPYNEKERVSLKQAEYEMNSSSQIRFFYDSQENLKAPNAIEQSLDYLDKIPSNSLIVEIAGGRGHLKAPKACSVEFVLDEESVILKSLRKVHGELKNLGKKLNKSTDKNESLTHKSWELKLGQVITSIEGIHLHGGCYFSGHIGRDELEEILEEFKMNLKTIDAEVKVLQLKDSFNLPSKSKFQDLFQEKIMVQDCTEASLFKHACENIIHTGITEGRVSEGKILKKDLYSGVSFYKELLKKFLE